MKNNSQKNILQFLKILLLKKTTKKEITDILNIKESTFYKYIYLIKKAGFVIDKENQTYKIVNFKNKINFIKKDTNLIAYLLFLSKKYLSEIKSSNVEKIIKYILTNSNINQYTEIEKKFNEFKMENLNNFNNSKLEEYQYYIDNKNILKITLKKHYKKIEIKPLELVWKDETLYIDTIILKSNTRELFAIKNILDAKIINQYNDFELNPKETIFELTGRLAKTYTLKENERLIDKFEDKIIIANCENNKFNLFKRLLKYDISCKVSYPQGDVENFKRFIKKSIENLK